MVEAFSMSPIDKIPGEDETKTPGPYHTKPVENWGWTDFLDYFDDSYLDVLKSPPPRMDWKKRSTYKKRIENSYQFWGKLEFRHMIDWLFDNYKQFPEWGEISIGILCGNHYWSNMIGEQAKKRVEFNR